tara:strand:- start:1738 stop:2658 length:921 start_codon:yes stop_codon:yes gene_type:complete
MNINRLTRTPEYRGVTILVCDFPCTPVFKDGTSIKSPNLLNRIEFGKNIIPGMGKEMEKKLRGETLLTLKYDSIANILSLAAFYTTSHLLSEEEMEKIGKWTKAAWTELTGFDDKEVDSDYVYDFILGKEDGKDIYFSKSTEKPEINMFPNYLPKGKVWMATLFETPEDQVRYESFLMDPIIFDRLVKLCNKKNLKVTDTMVTSSALPIHSKDTVSGELIIDTDVIKIFEQFVYYNNLLVFDKGTSEHDTGKLMALYPKLCDYIIHVAKRVEEGLPVNTENYEKQLLNAINYISRKPSLLKAYEDM